MMRGKSTSKPQPPKGGEGGQPKGKTPWQFPLWYLVVMILLLFLWQQSFSQLNVRTLPYSQFKSYLRQGQVIEANVTETEIKGKIDLLQGQSATENEAPSEAATDEPAETEFMFRAVRVEDPALVEELEAANVEYTGVRPSLLTEFLMVWLLPIALIVFIWIFLMKRMGGGHPMLNVGKSTARLLVDHKTGVAFKDVAGCDEAKYELQEVVDFLGNPGRYTAVGAHIPKGVLLVGPPGTGKTMLARAVAGEAGVPFFSISGSDFVEMFVGVGAARVRDLFQQAKKAAPCLIFIDELDAIGRQRGVNMGAANDEREQTLNQLLVEMDGFEANKGVIILAATNRPEVLDRAMLRPGRFDRQVVVDSPDLDGREAILKVHVKDKPLADDVNLRRVAQATPGFSGADLANALNESALLAARRRSKLIHQIDLEEAIEKVVAGPERRSRRLGEEEKKRVAYHEVGHALVAAFSPGSDPVHKISIVPRGRAALGYTMQVPMEQQFLMTRSELMARMRGLLGGRAAEEVVFGEITTGAENDLDRATAMARQMVAVYGMSDRVGLAHCAQRPHPFLGGDNYFQRECSEETAREIDEEVKRFLEEAYRSAKQILQERRDLLEKVTLELLQREAMDGHVFHDLIGKPMPKEKKLAPRPEMPPPPMPSPSN